MSYRSRILAPASCILFVVDVDLRRKAPMDRHNLETVGVRRTGWAALDRDPQQDTVEFICPHCRARDKKNARREHARYHSWRVCADNCFIAVGGSRGQVACWGVFFPKISDRLRQPPFGISDTPFSIIPVVGLRARRPSEEQHPAQQRPRQHYPAENGFE